MKKLIIILPLMILLIGCEKSIDGTDIDLNSITTNIIENSNIESASGFVTLSDIQEQIPTKRSDLNSMRMVTKLIDGKNEAGIKVPGFGGLTLGKKEQSLNVYYVETVPVKVANDTIIYGIGYSVHYLFKKVKRGIQLNNLTSVAASAQLQSNKTSVQYSLQTHGVKSIDLVKFFKPQVNSNFDVEGFGVIQSSIDGIHNVLSDSTLSAKTNYKPMKLNFLKYSDLQN